MTPEQEFQKASYKLLWYLSGWGGGDYCLTSRRDIIEGILQDLAEANLLSDEIHERGIEAVTKDYLGHPFHQKIKECLEEMPRENDEVLGGINGIFWIKD